MCTKCDGGDGGVSDRKWNTTEELLTRTDVDANANAKRQRELNDFVNPMCNIWLLCLNTELSLITKCLHIMYIVLLARALCTTHSDSNIFNNI